MKLVSCYIQSFGKLQDFSYDFNEDFNIIKQDNGWGKSTFASFIKCMFYGLSGSNKKSPRDNERLRFRPWNTTEKFGGHVVFIKDGKKYKLERYFGIKEAEDTAILYYEETGKTFSNTEDLGKRIFDVDEEGFLSTTYFGYLTLC